MDRPRSLGVRLTLAVVWTMARSRAAASFDRCSWMKAVVIARTTMAAMTTAARTSPRKYETVAKVSSSAFRGFRARPHSSWRMVALRSRVTRLGPNFFRRASASVCDRPSRRDPTSAHASPGWSRLTAARWPSPATPRTRPEGRLPAGFEKSFMAHLSITLPLGCGERH